MGRAILIVVAGIVLGLAIVWLVMSQAGPAPSGAIQPANDAYRGARPVQEPGR